MKPITKIFILGPWLSGKTTLAQLVAEKLDWKTINTDEMIVSETRKTIDEITEHGTNWQTFRNIELAVLKTLLREHVNVVIGCGGGVGVNDIIKHKTNKTYGAIERDLLVQDTSSVRVVLLPDMATFLTRVRQSEIEKFDPYRPLLDEKHAEALQAALKHYVGDPEKQRAIYIDAKVKSAQELYQRRIDLYKNLADLIIDTGKKSIDDCVAEIVRFIS